VTITPKHVMMTDIDKLEGGVIPDENDPGRAAVLKEMESLRKIFGSCIWLSIAYPQMLRPTCVFCKNMANPSSAQAHQVHAHARAGQPNWPLVWQKGWLRARATRDARRSRLRSEQAHVLPLLFGRQRRSSQLDGWCWHAVACGPIQLICLRQHHATPGSHASELTAGGTNVDQVVPLNGVLHELHIRLGKPTPFYLDSKSSVFVAAKDTAIKTSVWLMRRAIVLQEAVKLGEVLPIHVPDPVMVADALTKYLTQSVYSRHMAYIQNLPIDA
jgi:hypothetical protein